MKIVTLNELTDIIADIDYLFENTYPVKFEVNDIHYEAGITPEELQYIVNNDTDEVIMLDDPDDMGYGEICQVLEDIFKDNKKQR